MFELFKNARLQRHIKTGKPIEMIIGDEVYFINSVNEWQMVNCRTKRFYLFNFQTHEFDLIRADATHVETWNFYASNALRNGREFMITTAEEFMQNATPVVGDFMNIPYENLFFEMTYDREGTEPDPVETTIDILVDEANADNDLEAVFNDMMTEASDKLYTNGEPSKKSIEWVLSGEAFDTYFKLKTLFDKKVHYYQFVHAPYKIADLGRSIKYTINAICKMFGLKASPVKSGSKTVIFANPKHASV